MQNSITKLQNNVMKKQNNVTRMQKKSIFLMKYSFLLLSLQSHCVSRHVVIFTDIFAISSMCHL